MTAPVKGARRLTSANSPMNAISFLIERMMAGGLNTCTVVRVKEVDPNQARVVVTPLVPQIDGEGNTLAPQPIYDVPYLRIQGGVAALIIDPAPGDIGFCVFAQRDISTVKLTKDAGQPGSLRTFDQADAIYLGGILNGAPTVLVELTQDGKAKLSAPGGFTIEAPSTEITGTLHVVGAVSCDSTLHVVGAVTADSTLSVAGAVTAASTITAAGDVQGAGVSLATHLTTGVTPGAGLSGVPQ